jgi:CCR4-NOT transcription complex subunit 2
MNSANSITGMGYDQQLIQQYQHQQNSAQYRLQQMSAASQPFRDVGLKSMQSTQSNPDRFGLLGLLSVIKMSDPDLTSLALGIDLTTLGLNLNSTENLHKTFGSPWSNEPSKVDPEFSVPQCYYAKNPPPLHQGLFAKLLVETLFYVFYRYMSLELKVLVDSLSCQRNHNNFCRAACRKMRRNSMRLMNCKSFSS